ncbi:metalloregulator ArsR/SmtB family transcription factor [Micromonospora sp. WMMD712]|uniref:metalloregulator ArsR/SmtB family transcription factor n=1 Tax=Micromonospora sp. WMMD712 TaxID=3016096 RepID=UPI00249B25F7|nr:metalloregulator ArsR/SmtB family transcription factor [Micromonospora sp. WMMD712]WFE60165.1 metalloregulator ArsR/SmtB family transcription factor [Micromonospora sp. WMMD712]
MDEVAAAIADPVRRDILVMLRGRRLAAGQIADRFVISRPAVSRHLRVLRESGLVRDTLVGRRRLYELDASPFGELVEWLGQFTAAGQVTAADQVTAAAGWERRLDALETEVHRTRRERRRRDAPDHPRERTA